MKRTKAQMIQRARRRIESYQSVLQTAFKVRQHLEAMRREAAEMGDLPRLDAIATVSDTVALWENYGRNVERLRGFIGRLRGAA